MLLPFELLLLSAWTVSATTTAAINLPEWSHHQELLSPNPNNKNPSSEKPTYKCFQTAYPSSSTWLPFPSLWNLNREQILSSNGGDTYLQHYIHESILRVAAESGVDARFILAVVMQESKGKANAACISKGERCGIMHAHKGERFDAERAEGSVLRMVREGVEGREGLAGLLKGRNVYAAARMYNSGEVGGDLDVVGKKGRGEAGYVNDLANRLVGWDGRGKGFKSCQS